ncbi:NUDIX hydrolase [Phaeodactylibacter luteus]|uniref:CoA pyrophosphatase n=1 Tax=Phaeodactylibacter luteus TaxID=1564516 RepID=A0A5C6RHF2_9BACT|nr:CoA pyrophosphatase [Phaeodactylibacter luteus]TXB60062.1 CoA pyrophosphatase [Phaeodactylibacter luteus]
MKQDRLILALSDELQKQLPGQEAQYQMAHGVRQRVAPPPANARQAGVMALFYPVPTEGWHLVFIERQRSANNPNDRHAGQISFPGGKHEPEDPSMEYTALRETEEEVGVDRQSVTVIGKLTELYIPVSNFLVHPYVGIVERRPQFVPDPAEVQRILEVPFGHLQHPKARQRTDLELAQNLILKGVPYFNVGGKVLWGATAMMVSELVAVAERAMARY